MRLNVRAAVWLAAAGFTVLIAVSLFAVLGFGRGPRELSWRDVLADAVTALAMATASQLGLALVPLARTRGARAAVTALMVPALLWGTSALAESAMRLGAGESTALFRTFLPYYALMLPVYAAALVWLWRGRRAPAASAPAA